MTAGEKGLKKIPKLRGKAMWLNPHCCSLKLGGFKTSPLKLKAVCTTQKDKQKENHWLLGLVLNHLMCFPMKQETEAVYEPSYRNLKSSVVTNMNNGAIKQRQNCRNMSYDLTAQYNAI